MWERTNSSQGARVFMLTAAGSGAGCTYMVRGLGKRADVSFAFACGYPAAVIVLHAETSSAASLPPLAAAGTIAYGPAQAPSRFGEVGGGTAAGHRARPPSADFAGMGERADGSLRGWASELMAAVDGVRRWKKVVDAACILHAVCMIFPGALDLPALLMGAFEYFVSGGAMRPAASISFNGTGLAVVPGVVRAAMRWRFGAAASIAWRAPRRHFRAGTAGQVVYNIISPL